MKNQSVKNNLDWISVFIYLLLVIMGWLNIYSSSLSTGDETAVFDLSQFYGKQLMYIILTIPLIIVILSGMILFLRAYFCISAFPSINTVA